MMKFKMEDSLMMLRGDPSLCKFGVSLKFLMKDLRQYGQGIMMEMCCLHTEVNEEIYSSMASTLVQGLFEWHPEVFEAITELPPFQDVDHAICLEPGTTLVNIQPYRYPHFQKNKIEWLMRKICATGIIQPSTSPFSSPMLLMKKKDGSW